MSSDDNKTDFIPNPTDLDGVPDLSQLIYLDMKNVLHNLEFRYAKMATKKCYTSISSILLAINPYEYLPIYGDDVVNQFKKAQETGRLITDRPHPYSVSARSYMRLVQRKKNQSVIVCGESGAGKTETTKKLLKYLAVTAPALNQDQAAIEEQIVAASPILEAYGNAKTVMNNNSSRFGKFTKLIYNVPENKKAIGSILGSSLETYLLEKSRVVFQSEKERNYHIFYFMHAGFENNITKKNDLCLDNCANFHYTSQGNCFEPFKDKEEFNELTESLSKFRINITEQDSLFRITSGILNLGNIKFNKKGNGYSEIDKSTQKYVDNVAKLWGINAKALVKRLTTASVVINRQKIIKEINYSDADSNRDSISKGIYENIFLWLCGRINSELYLDEAKNNNKNQNENELKFIGILDVFGFENFWTNSLEQFCINYTNEKLQQFFNFHIIRSEQEEYLKESIVWKPLKIPDNQDYINLVEDKKTGFFTLLDSQCKGPSKNDYEAFMQQLVKKHKDNKTFKRVNKQGAGGYRGGKKHSKKGGRRKSKKGKQSAKFDGFTITHFADIVSYDISEFLKKNVESVHSDTFAMIKKSSQPILTQMRQSGKSKKKKSVTSVFHNGIKKLMKDLKKTEPYFVRCINPNKQKSSTVFNNDIVQHQLKCGGLMEALKVLKLGYPTRVPYDTLYEKFHSNVDNPLIKNMGKESFSTSLLIAFDVNENDYELGLTKIFFKPAKAAILDTIMSQADKPLTAAQNEKITRFIVGKRIRTVLGCAKSFVYFRRKVRMMRANIAWKYSGRIASIIGSSVIKHLTIVRKKILERNKQKGAIAMQIFYRSYIQRIAYKQKVTIIKQATRDIWLSYRIMQQRKGLTKWLFAAVAETAQRNAKILAEKLEKERKELEEKQNEEERIKREEKAAAALLIAQKKKEEADEFKKQNIIIITPSPSNKQKKEAKALKDLKEKEEIVAAKKRQSLVRKQLQKTKTLMKLKLVENIKVSRQQTIQMTMNQKSAADHESALLAVQDEDEKDDYSSSDDLKTDDDDDGWVSDSSGDEEDDDTINKKLLNFQTLSSFGAKFQRHVGGARKLRKKHVTLERMVKISYNINNIATTLSWGVGSRSIKISDIWYVSWGHYTPTFIYKSSSLDPLKCFSIVGHSEKQVLDLEALTQSECKLWVKGLRKLINQNDSTADQLSSLNKTRLINYAKKLEEERKNLKDKQLRVVQLQQDLFVMTVDTIYKELEEQKIWKINTNVKQLFSASKMYKDILKHDIPWRKWQWYIREQITNYLREHGLVEQQQTSGNTSGDNDTDYDVVDEISLFLKHYKLTLYNKQLRDNGFDTLSILKSLNNSEIVNICREIKMKTLHEKKFIIACRDVQNNKYPPVQTKQEKEIDLWLKKNDLFQYINKIKKNGITKLKDIFIMNENELNQFANECGMKMMHKKKFINACLKIINKNKNKINKPAADAVDDIDDIQKTKPNFKQKKSTECRIM